MAAINRYGLRDLDQNGDLFRGKGRVRLSYYKGCLPPSTQEGVIREWGLVDELEKQILDLEAHLKNELKLDPAARQLKSLPGVGSLLGTTIYLEIGDISRFASAQRLASYAGLVPVMHASGGRVTYGPTSNRANHYLRWACVEAANCIAGGRKQRPSAMSADYTSACAQPRAIRKRSLPWRGT